MNVLLNCPLCQEQIQSELTSDGSTLRCGHCPWTKEVPTGDIAAGLPQRCVSCGCEDLWRQKDFPVALGMAFVVLGSVLFATAMAYYLPWEAIGILLVFAATDLALYVFMKDILVCYRCHARYRSLPPLDAAPKFELEKFEKYRQETARLKEASAGPASTPSINRDKHPEEHH